MAAYKYVKNKKESDKSVSFKFKGDSYSPGDTIELSKSEFEKLNSRYVLEPVSQVSSKKEETPEKKEDTPFQTGGLVPSRTNITSTKFIGGE